MPRLTKNEIQTTLLKGDAVAWTDATGKSASLRLVDPKQRRLLAYVLTSDVRQPTALPATFIAGLQEAFEAKDDPAHAGTSLTSKGGPNGPWKLRSIRTEGFGGLNTWNGAAFELDFDAQSFILEGPNGCGKSSLVGAITWALSGERPRDQSTAPATTLHPVFGDAIKPAGEWPPIACYPPTVSDLKINPEVSVLLTFVDPAGVEATVERRLKGGKVTETISGNFDVPSTFVETGVLMPSRLAHLRLDQGGGHLTTAVQALTGMDDFIAVGLLAEGLCHKSREYRSYGTKELSVLQQRFDENLEKARAALKAVEIAVPAFKPSDTDTDDGEMATLGKRLKELAVQHASVIASDLHADLALDQLRVQADVNAAIAAAKSDVAVGLEQFSVWKLISGIKEQLPQEHTEPLKAAIQTARSEFDEALRLLRQSEGDNRFQLKALGARWHSAHAEGPIDNCPICENSLKDKPELAAELESLKSAGEAATRTFGDNVNAALVKLEGSLPAGLRKSTADILQIDPRASLLKEIREKLEFGDRYSTCLIKVAALVGAAIEKAPTEALAAATPDRTPAGASAADPLFERIAIAERLVALTDWFSRVEGLWNDWWVELAGSNGDEGTQAEAGEAKHVTLNSHLEHLFDVLAKSGPYRESAEAMRVAWKAGADASKLQKEVDRRTEIAECLTPLKSLGPLCESVARDAINGLSGRISTLLGEILIAEQLQYQKAALSKKEGLVVQAGFSGELRIDATLVANSSWLRAVLWSFVFALREEAIEQFGGERFALVVFDDPQATFDTYHRARWAHYIADLQNGPSKIQVLLTTYDEAFVDLVRYDGVHGRQALLVAPSPSSDRVSVLEGASIDRAWTEADAAKTPKAAMEFLAKVRVHVEGLLKLMFRGEDAKVRSMLLGDLRAFLQQMNTGGKAPWDAPVFGTLLNAIAKTRSETSYIEGSHHSTGKNFGMVEAKAVHTHWKKTLGPSIDRAFRTAREHRLLHGGMKALYPLPVVVSLPDGHQPAVQSIPLNILGKAAALTDGRAADGAIDIDHYDPKDHVAISLGKHSAFRLVSRTLEPVARPGDILLTRDYGEVSSKSLVVVQHDGRILARRFEISANASDVAALTAQAINPREIAPPVIAHRGSIEPRKVVGVLFASSRQALSQNEHEVCDCGGASAFSHLTKNALGLVQVDGRSAEPLALDQQYLIVHEAITPEEAARTLEGKPVIAEDSNGHCFFKRLRVQASGQVVLESLDSGGDFEPVMLTAKDEDGPYLAHVWPVAGVLFDLPS